MSLLRGGVVTSFEDHAGLGTIRDDDGVEYQFHCTQIADGSRSIAPDTQVEFDLVPGHLGRWEATAIRPCGGWTGGGAV